MQIFLIRHTTLDVAKTVCYGQTDLSIDETSFKKELNAIQTKLPDEIDLFFSSPLKRCTLLAQQLSSCFETDKQLMELNFGEWENKKWSTIDETALNLWMNDFVNVCPPNGENYIALYERTLNFLKTLLKTPGKKVAIITHAGNIRSIISYVLDLALENSFRIALDYGAVVNIQLENEKHLCKLISIQ